MEPISIGRLLGPARVVAVALAMTVLSVGATGPTVAATPGPMRSAAPPSIGVSPAPAVLAFGPGLLAELAVDPSLVARLQPSTDAGPTADVVRAVAAPAARAVKATPAPAKPRRAASSTREHHGRNHVWSASLGLDRGVSWFSCSRSRPPDYMVYRWGCAGPNNIYLFAHAGGPFRRLHDLYVQGRLRKGMTVSYADAGGHVHRYSVAWWRVVLPTAGGFAYAGQARPSMTLQTCVGPHDRDRLIVRLYRDD